jgi:outer membrane protein assembly factor BamE
MSATPDRLTRVGLALVAAGALASCGTFDNVSQRMAGAITPYRIEVVQGNFISREQVQQLKAGMTRQQVREMLGTPLVTSVFHAERWDYVFTLKREGVEPQRRKFTLFFRGDALERFEGDPMPSESEFVATLGTRRVLGKVPPLVASEESLKAFPARAPAAAAEPAPATAPPATNYPPLEPPAR